MCGIVGYVGHNNAVDTILDGLSKLEYRGYDSAGISVIINDKIDILKAKGKLINLKDKVYESGLSGNLGIGHTRWATHGEPNDINSHPHLSMHGKYSVVHNGIIENYKELKEYLIKKGYMFESETDTEVIAHLLEDLEKDSLIETVYAVLKKIRGSYALGIISKSDTKNFVAVRKGSPLIIGLGENENFIASDVPALLKYTRNVIYLNDNEVALLANDKVIVYDNNKNILNKEIMKIEWDIEAASKNGYDHFMLKEIHEQPKAILETLERRLTKGKLDYSDIGNLDFTKDIEKIEIIAAGTAYHAGLIGKNILSDLAKIPCSTYVSSEYKYENTFTNSKTLTIIVSQSGETIDTLYALRKAKESGAIVLAITNVVGSSIAREADYTIYTWAGPEIAVASTKAYTTQMLMFYMLSLEIGLIKGNLTKEMYNKELKILTSIPDKIEEVLKQAEVIKDFSTTIKDANNGFYIGRGKDYYTAMEGSLKMKEISYIHTEAFPAGELKHGSIALIEPGTLTVLVSTNAEFNEKNLSNIKEIKARGAFVITVSNDKFLIDESDLGILIPNFDEKYSQIISVIPLQLLAYYTSLIKGNDVDKPRNLAKSVTVE